uniref:Uncharacterized protein n=1 Tax=Panagrolaimus davidi TaxID=227884 RepID=A0A914PMX2_9BILA
MSQGLSQEKGTLVYIRGFEGNLYMTTIDSRTGRIGNNESKKLGGCKRFVSEIPKLLKKNVKAVVFNVFTLETSNYANNYEFRKAIKAKMEQLKIPYIFVCEYQYLCASVLTFSNVTVTVGEMVLIILVNENGVQVMELKYTAKGYESDAETRVFDYNPTESNETIRQRIVGTSTPKKIIVDPNAAGYPIMKRMKALLNFKDLIITEYDLIPYDGKVIHEMAKHVFDESYTKFWVIPKAFFGYCIRLSTGIKEYDLLYFLGDEKLPAKKDLVLAKESFNFTFLARNNIIHREEPIETFTLPTNCHRVRIILSLDSNNHPSYQVVPEMIPKIQVLPDFLSRFVPSKAPVIGFFDNSSVICHHKDGCYKFLDTWNGVYGREMLISFASKKAKFMEDAVEDLRTKPSYVVLDLARITAMPINEVKNNGPWNFAFTKDEKNPVLVEFDNYGGVKKAASPAFLMAMLLKEHLKAIKDEIGEKPTEVVFCLLDDFYKPEEQSRITVQFEEACKLLKIETSILFHFLLAV